MKTKKLRELLTIAGVKATENRQSWTLEETETAPEEKYFKPKTEPKNMVEMRRLAGITSQFPKRQLEGGHKPSTLLEWGLRGSDPKKYKALAELNKALEEATTLLNQVFDNLGDIDVDDTSYDYFARLIGQAHKRRMQDTLSRWGIDAEPRYQLPSAMTLINQTRKRFDLPIESIPVLGSHL